MKVTQKDTNPFVFSDTNKRYHTYEYYLRHRYGEKCAKLTLDAGMTCPNIDGTKGVGGCIYCSSAGSGDCTRGSFYSISEQYCLQREAISSKWQCRRFIPYLQAHTNTYAPVEQLRRVYEEVLSLPDVAALHIATRADCLSNEVTALLAEVAERVDLVVELGLQSVHEQTAKAINRCHTYDEFLEGYRALRCISNKIGISVHLINGLPGEDTVMMLESARLVGLLRPDQLKIHLLHVLRGTPLAAVYEAGGYVPMTQEDYVSVLVRQLEVVPAQTVIGRVTGDGPASELLAPLWSLKKVNVINRLDQALYTQNTWQGRLFI